MKAIKEISAQQGWKQRDHGKHKMEGLDFARGKFLYRIEKSQLKVILISHN